MNKMTFALIALLTFGLSNLDARSRCSSGTCGTQSCAKVVDDCVEIPKCFVWQKVPACPQKHVYYTCPEDTNIGDCVCTPQEKIYGGAAPKESY